MMPIRSFDLADCCLPNLGNEKEEGYGYGPFRPTIVINASKAADQKSPTRFRMFMTAQGE